MIGLAVPLNRKQIEAAGRLHAELPFWRAADRALEALNARFPGFREESALLKTVAINSLYYTNVYAIGRMARHVESVMSEADISTAGPELVERLAMLPRSMEHGKQFRFHSFASKFAHFYIDPERFPILDSYAISVIKLHLGSAQFHLDRSQPYLSYVENFKKLMTMSGWKSRARQLDHYLWIAGQYRAFLKNPTAQINTELKQLFADPPTRIKRDLDALMPTSPKK